MSINLNTIYAIEDLHRAAEPLEDFNGLGLYLAKQNNPLAIKTLDLLIMSAGDTGAEMFSYAKNIYLDQVTKVKTETGVKKNTITGNIVDNTLMLSEDLLEFMVHTYPLNLRVRDDVEADSILERYLSQLVYFDDSDNLFYQRKDIINKRLAVIDYLIENVLVSPSELEIIKAALVGCITSGKKYFTDVQLHYMRSLLKRTVRYPKPKDVFDFKEYNIMERLEEHPITSEEHDYILRKVPKIVDSIAK